MPEPRPELPPDAVTALFTRADGRYLCARWRRPVAPVVFGVDDATLATVKRAFETVTALAGHPMAETDPELGANVIVFFVRDWAELAAVPDLGRMIDGLPELLQRLDASDATQYRVFRFDPDGAIRAVFVFLRMNAAMAALPADALALSQVAQVMLTWSEGAFAARSPVAEAGEGRVGLHPEVAATIRAAYDPVLPDAATDPSHALRLAARIAAVP